MSIQQLLTCPSSGRTAFHHLVMCGETSCLAISTRDLENAVEIMVVAACRKKVLVIFFRPRLRILRVANRPKSASERASEREIDNSYLFRSFSPSRISTAPIGAAPRGWPGQTVQRCFLVY